MKNKLILASILITILSGCVENAALPKVERSSTDTVLNLFSAQKSPTQRILIPASPSWSMSSVTIDYSYSFDEEQNKIDTACEKFLNYTLEKFQKKDQELTTSSYKTGIVLDAKQEMTLASPILGLLFMSDSNNKVTLSEGAEIGYLRMKKGTLVVDSNTLKICGGSIDKETTISSENGGTIEMIGSYIYLLDDKLNNKTKSEFKLHGIFQIDGTIKPNLKISGGEALLKENALLQGTLENNNGKVFMDGGRITGTVKNSSKYGDTEFFIKGGVMEKDFENSDRGRVHFSGTANAEIKGNFSSLGQDENNIGSMVSLGMGPYTLTTGPIQFDEKTRVHVFLHGSNPAIPLVKSTGNIDLAKATFTLSTIGLKETVKKGEYILFKAAPGNTISNLNDVLKGDKTDICTVTLVGNELILAISKDIAGSLDSRKKRHHHHGLHRPHGHPNDCARSHISSLQTGIAFDAKANQTSLTNGLSLTTSENSEKSYQFLSMDQKTGSESFGVYAGYAAEKNTIRDFGAYQMSSFGSFNVTNHFGFSGNTDEKFEDGIQFNSDSKSLFATSQISLPVSFGNFTFSPKMELGYHQILDAKNSFTEEEEIFNVSSNSTGSFEGVIGLDITSKFNFNGIALESFASLNFTSELGSQNITETSVEETFSYTDSYSFVDFKAGINGTLDANSKMYASFKISSEKNDADSTKALEMGMNFKI